MRTLSKEQQEKITPNQALEILKRGNERFVHNLKVNRNLLEQVNETREGQWPFAVILSCMDSRTSAELIFDQGLGDIFSVRIAGNVLNNDILGSMEFACQVAGAKFILVLGHTKCGAVKGVCEGVQLGHLTTLLSKIEPAVDEARKMGNFRTADDLPFAEQVAQINVRKSVAEILKQSTILKQMVEEGKIGIGGGMYDVASGVVDFFEDTMIIRQSQERESATFVTQ